MPNKYDILTEKLNEMRKIEEERDRLKSKGKDFSVIQRDLEKEYLPRVQRALDSIVSDIRGNNQKSMF
jgi:hypothetical protein